MPASPSTIEPAGVDEDEVKRSLWPSRAAPQELAATLAELKAERLWRGMPAAMVIGANSTLACNGRQFDKPPTLAAAREQLLALAGQTHELCSVGGGGARQACACGTSLGTGAELHAALRPKFFPSTPIWRGPERP